ncbi:hypothetical protein [Nocardia brasiliensis]|uniref:hypothetical protein n=1 Tax=Nocardia brasiliensis TaxID=37326 RepID=UPI0036735C01
MKPSRTDRFGIVAVLAYAGPIAMGSLLACGSNNPAEPPGTATTAMAVAPTALRWQSFQGVNLPVAQEGPRRLDSAVATGFDRGPAGAALAAIHSTVRMSIATDSQWPLVGQRMLATGRGRDRWATARAQISITAPIATGAPKVLGYTVTRYVLDAADVEIYSIHPDDSVIRNSTRVIWQDDDWRLLLPENPTASPMTAVDLPPAEMVALAQR